MVWVVAAAAVTPGWLAASAAAPGRSSGPQAVPDGALVAVTSTTVLADWLEELGGARWQVRALLAPGAHAHAFEPSPADAAWVERARLVVLAGPGLEGPALSRLMLQARSRSRVVELAPKLGGDPHFWTSVPLAMQAVRELEGVLRELDPEGAEGYRSRAWAYLAQLQELDRWIRARVSELAPQSRLVVTSHPFLEPFIQEYGLRGVGSLVQGGADLEQLSAGQLARLADRLQQAGVRVLFTDSAVPAPAVRQLARALGARVVVLHSDSLGPAGSGAATYQEYMRTNVARVVEALGRGR